MAILANQVFKACEADFFDALSERGYHDIRMRHTALFEVLDEDGTRGGVLAERLGMTQQAMGQFLDEVEAAGYISRIPDPADRRARIVMLTERGKDAVSVAYALLEQIEADYVRLLGGSDFLDAKQALARLLEGLRTRRRTD